MARKPADQTVSREGVLRAAAHVFRLRGYHGATMQHIGDALGLRQSSLYHYFPSKHDLLLTLLNEGLERLTLVVSEAACPHLPPDARLRAAVTAYLTCVAQYPDVALVTILEVRALLETPAERRAYIARRDALEYLFATILADGVQQGVFKPLDVSIVTKLLFSIHNWFVMWYRPDGRLSAEAIADLASEFCLSALKTGDSGVEMREWPGQPVAHL
ncbi:MAG: TetR family transcriptional regulator [Anaerolineae bacterium]|nr:TetR family transcriptional regulator [Anaerolineae bacterium]